MTQINIIPIDTRGRANFEVTRFRRDLQMIVRDVTVEGQRFIARYPPQHLRRSGYIRTGTLRRSWSHRLESNRFEISGEVGSNSRIALYNTFVQGPNQRALFRGAGWRNVTELADRMENQMLNEVQNLIDQLTR